VKQNITETGKTLFYNLLVQGRHRERSLKQNTTETGEMLFSFLVGEERT
jgi:hypothetical protein